MPTPACLAALTSASRAAAPARRAGRPRGVADDDHLDGAPRSRPRPRRPAATSAGRERAALRRPLGVVQPGAQLALLAAGQPGDLARLVGVALDQRQRLQHRVVQVRGDVGPLLGADRAPRAPRSGGDQPPPQRRGRQHDADQDHQRRGEAVAGVGQLAGGGQQQHHARRRRARRRRPAPSGRAGGSACGRRRAAARSPPDRRRPGPAGSRTRCRRCGQLPSSRPRRGRAARADQLAMTTPTATGAGRRAGRRPAAGSSPGGRARAWSARAARRRRRRCRWSPRTAKATRTISGSCRRCAAVPAATPASSRPDARAHERRPRDGAAGRAGAVVVTVDRRTAACPARHR